MVHRLLITGFEPFNGAQTNPSWEAVRLLPDGLDGWVIQKACLPVEYERAGRTVLELAESLKPRLVICIGLAAGRKGVTPEMTAVNLRSSRVPDNAGRLLSGEKIDPAGRAGYLSDLPVRAMTDALTEAGFPAHVSHSAGSFVCNDVFYRLMQKYSNTQIRCGFIHVPGEDVLPAERCAEALKICIRTAIAACEDGGEAAR